MELNLQDKGDKESVLNEVETYINGVGLKIADADRGRPWGGFFVIAKESTDHFIDTFFPEIDKQNIYKYGEELSPKILVVEPGQKLSWQYHNRRAELWKDIVGPVGIMVSENDNPPESHEVLSAGEAVQHGNQVRHRLIGLESWGVLAEIWQHTEPGNPSDEDDIIRLEDQYGRD